MAVADDDARLQEGRFIVSYGFQRAVMIMCAIKAHSGSDLACIDVTGVFLYAMTEEDIFMLLKIPLEEMMAVIKPQLYLL